MRYQNPVLPGFHPDPSVCRVGDTFYLATSSFHFFPGIPLWRSKNLVDWELVGHGITRPSQIDLAGTGASRGLYAPTIRHRKGMFYITCTEVDRGGNFIIAAPSIEGPWSDPILIRAGGTGIGGIDPSLFFDEDGTAYLCSNGEVDGAGGVALSVIDPGSGAITERPRHICAGSGGRWPEGPHLYRIGGMYYLLMSEGGTEYGHMVTAFRAPTPWGPYEACPRNPVLSHRDSGLHPIQCVGHADIVDDVMGNWWLVCLGVRPLGPLLHNLGRETFLAPVTWDEEGWPVMGRKGVIDPEMEGPLPLFPASSNSHDSPSPASPAPGWSDAFGPPDLSRQWSFVRSRLPGTAGIAPGGGLILRGERAGLSDPSAAPAFVGRPQTSFDCTFGASLEFHPESEGSEAGIAAYYDEAYHYEIFVTARSRSRVVCLRKRVHDLEAIVASAPLPETGSLRLRIAADRERYRFFYECGSLSGEIGSGMTAGLCTEGTYRMTFTAVFFGLYCVQGKALFRDCACVDAVSPLCYPRQ